LAGSKFLIEEQFKLLLPTFGRLEVSQMPIKVTVSGGTKLDGARDKKQVQYPHVRT